MFRLNRSALVMSLLAIGVGTGCYKWSEYELDPVAESASHFDWAEVTGTDGDVVQVRDVRLGNYTLTGRTGGAQSAVTFPLARIKTLAVRRNKDTPVQRVEVARALTEDDLGMARVTKTDGAVIELRNARLETTAVTGDAREEGNPDQVSIPLAVIQKLEVRERDDKGMLLLAGGAAGVGVLAVILTGGDGERGYTPPDDEFPECCSDSE